MRHFGAIFGAAFLLLTQGAPAEAGSLEVLVQPGRVAVQADEVPLGQIVDTLAKRAGLHVVMDEGRAMHPVTVRLRAAGIQEAIERIIREAGGGNYAIVRADAHGKVDTLLFRDAGDTPTMLAPPSQPTYPPAPYATPPSAGGGATYADANSPPPYSAPPAAPYPAGGGAAYAPAAGEPRARVAPSSSSLLTEFEEEERTREDQEGRRGTKDFD